jgi:hypothetical protein
MNDTKLNLTRITPICIDGREIDEEKLERYRSIIKYMTSSIDFHEIVFIGTRDLEIEGVRFIKINHISIGEYSRLCIKELDTFYSSDFCLVFQDDGFILNPELWNNDFYNYDYIGAPWPLYIGWPKEGRQVGNGGFSLRSRKFTSVSSELPGSYNNEDTYILMDNKGVLEDNNIKIAPLEVAINFSVENPIDDSHNIYTCFGFHSKELLIEVLKNKIIR